MQLAPWRKGPFDVGGVHIDAEWRSDLKWQRVAGAIGPLQGRRVLDVGCGNGYYALRMADAGAGAVLGIDPTLLYVMQFLGVTAHLAQPPVAVLPLRLQELPDSCHAFDTTFSMGVLYHQRSPLDHLRQLRASLRPGGQLVLETIFIPGKESFACTPADRYARMKNVWLLPTIAELTTWLRRSGFRDVEIIDTAVTTVEEQRSTEWMTFESLADALDPEDPTRTIEGWPAPRRVVATAIAP
jgi:tRNA (mo5U34)-methyltransferase